MARRPGAPSSFRINGGNAASGGKESSGPDSDSHRAPSPKGNRNAPITEERLTEAWQQFIGDHTEHKIVIHTMQTHVPRHVADGLYYIEVANPAQQAQFAQIITELSTFMRDRLENDSFRLEVRLQEGSDGQKMLTPREFVSNAVQQNRQLSDLLGFLDAELI